MTTIRAWLHGLRLSPPVLRLQSGSKHLRRRLRFASRSKDPGNCPICERQAQFVHVGDNPRESPICMRCGSVPRQRALVSLLSSSMLPIADRRTHESSPSLCTYELFRRRCRSFTASYFLPSLASGAAVGAFRNVDLGHQPFPDGCFDLVVTLDVLEHLPEPMLALREICRTLAPGGVHVFTVPRVHHCDTRVRARRGVHGIEHLCEPEFHRDPVARGGALVFTDWGRDLEQLVMRDAGAICEATQVQAPRLGVPMPVEVFTLRRPDGS